MDGKKRRLQAKIVFFVWSGKLFLSRKRQDVSTYSLIRVLLAATVLHSVSTDASSGWGLGKSGKQTIHMKCYNILFYYCNFLANIATNQRPNLDERILQG